MQRSQEGKCGLQNSKGDGLRMEEKGYTLRKNHELLVF